MLKLTNTLTGASETFTPADGVTVRMYTCGPTVYDFAHIGNFRTYVFEDVLRRHLKSKWKLRSCDEHHGHRRQDHPEGRSEKGIDIRAYTAPFTEAFFEDSEQPADREAGRHHAQPRITFRR